MHYVPKAAHNYRGVNVCKHVSVTGSAVALCFSLCQDWHAIWPAEPNRNKISLLARFPAAMASALSEKDIQLDTNIPIMQERCKYGMLPHK